MEQGTTTGALNFFKARLTSGCERRVESESAVSNTDEHPIPSFNLLDVAETITSDGIQHSDHKFRIAGHGNWMLVFWRLMLNRLPQEYEERYRHGKYENCALAVFENIDGEMVLTQDNIIIN